jgi:hypothetical protein
MECAKCKSEATVNFVQEGTVYPVCETCLKIIESFPVNSNIAKEFFKYEDSMTQVMKNIFEARKRRAQGHKWNWDRSKSA